MISRRLSLCELPGLLAICRLEPNAPIPEWAMQAEFFSITRTPEELSIVLMQESVPDREGSQEFQTCERNWRALKVEGPLDFALTGVLVSLCAPLAEAKIGVFAISTYDTDYVLVKEADWEKTIAILRQYHEID